MDTSNPPLPPGYSPLAPGMIANVVTCFEMTEKPRPSLARRLDHLLDLRRVERPDLADYRALFRRVGQDWLWYSRLVMPDADLRAILESPAVEVYILRRDGETIGLLELDFRQAGQCELAFFGLVTDAIGKGAGRFLMDQAIAKAWAKPIQRFWVHTCTFDQPSAIDFYQRSGFRPYAFAVEVQNDPRLTGHLPRTVAPRVPVINGQAER